MTPLQAAQRLGVHETAVRAVEERENDSVVTLRDERRMLVSDTVARPYVPEADDAAKAAEPVEEPDDGAETDTTEPVEEKPKRPYNRRTKG